MHLVWRASARADILEITAYVAQRNPLAAADLNDRIQACVERLATHPQMYRPGRISGTREALVHPNYLLVYRVGDDAIEIINVMHSRQQYPAADD